MHGNFYFGVDILFAYFFKALKTQVKPICIRDSKREDKGTYKLSLALSISFRKKWENFRRECLAPQK